MAAPASNRLFIADLPPHFDEAATQQIFDAYGTINSLKMMPARKEGDKSACIIDFADAQEAQWIVTNLNGNMPQGLSEPVIVRFANAQKGKVGGKGDVKGWGKGGKEAAPAALGAGGSWVGAAATEGAGGYGKGKSCGKAAAAGPYDGKGAGKKGGKDGIKGLLDGAAKGGHLPDNGLRPESQCVYVRGLPPDTTDLDLYKLFAGFGAIPPRGVKAMKNADGTCTSIGFVDFTDPAAAHNAIAALNGYPLPDGKTLFLKTKNPAGSGKGGKDGKDGKDGKGKAYDGKGKNPRGDGKGKAWAAPAALTAGASQPALPAPPPPPVRPAPAA